MDFKKRVLIITGNGKGKTTASIGIIIRSLGHKKRVALIKFFKGQKSGEDKILKKLGIEIYKFGQEQFFNPKKIPKTLKRKIQQGWEQTQKLSEQVDLLIMDEVNLALAGDLIKKEEVKNFIKNSKAHLVFTGRFAPLWLKRLADTVSEIKDIKHKYQNGGGPEKGIEW